MPDEPRDTTDQNGEPKGAAEKADDGDKLPPPPHHEEETITTSHRVKVGRRTIDYSATAARLVLTDEEGKKQASFFSIAYTKEGVDDPATRPLVFAFNGGPGSSSVWLHFGVFGPRRVDLGPDGMGVRPPGKLIDNEHTLLEVADLVFIDPVSTGYSRAIPEKEAKDYHHFKKDIESVGEFIRLYLTRNERWASPKFLAGESYGTTRSAGLAGHLLKRHGITFNGILLISSILNFQTAGFDRETWTFNRGNDLPYIVFLPTYAAVAWYHGKVDKKYQKMKLRPFLDEVERFASTDYTLALTEGDELAPKRFDEIADSLARFTGLSKDYIVHHDLRIEILRFCKELLREEHRTIGRIDGRYKGIDRFAGGHAVENDPSIDAVMGPYTATFNDYVRRELGYETDLPYEILTDRVWPWSYEDFQNAYVDVSETLREAMSRNPFLKVFVANGYYDLATPHFATEYTFSHMGLDPALRDNVEMTYYEAGHMMYVHLPSLARLAADLKRFVVDAAG